MRYAATGGPNHVFSATVSSAELEAYASDNTASTTTGLAQSSAELNVEKLAPATIQTGNLRYRKCPMTPTPTSYLSLWLRKIPHIAILADAPRLELLKQIGHRRQHRCKPKSAATTKAPAAESADVEISEPTARPIDICSIARRKFSIAAGSAARRR